MSATVPVENHAGWSGLAQAFRARAIVTCDNLPDATGAGFDPGDGKRLMTVTVSRFFQRTNANLFQAMLFFQHDLELHPGAAMTLYGLVHTNSNFFAATGASLTFSSNVSFAGDTKNPVSADALNNKPGTAALTPTNSVSKLAESDISNTDSRGYVDGVTKVLLAPGVGKLE